MHSVPGRHDTDVCAAVGSASELIQELQGCQIENGLPIGPGFGQMVNQPLIILDPVQAFAGEDGTGAASSLDEVGIEGVRNSDYPRFHNVTLRLIARNYPHHPEPYRKLLAG